MNEKKPETNAPTVKVRCVVCHQKFKLPSDAASTCPECGSPTTPFGDKKD
jgi:rRNA maturation endonuclease Nob1